jgi:hypothetical protein
VSKVQIWRYTCPITGQVVDIDDPGGPLPPGWNSVEGEPVSGQGQVLMAMRIVDVFRAEQRIPNREVVLAPATQDELRTVGL